MPTIGSVKRKKQRGRGDRNGQGKTSGRGQKGWKARNGRNRPSPAFEGGQTGLINASPEFGMPLKNLLELHEITLRQVQIWADAGRIDVTKTVTIKHLHAAKCIPEVSDGILLSSEGSDKFTLMNLNIQVQETDPATIRKIESNKGTIKSVWYDREDLECMLHPHRFIIKPSALLFPSRKDLIQRFSDYAHRGYLLDLPPSKLVALIHAADAARR